ncbi:MAG: hypothetical protein AB1762_18445 [Gemmatimonadota bacterium]
MASDTAMKGMPGMDSMPGMGGMMSDSVMMAAMHTHMQTMDTASASSLQSMWPMHQQMLNDMLSRMDSSMRAMNMTADAAWTATQDSLRQDMSRMQAMTPDQLKQAMAAHHARVMRLMDMHRQMMKGHK